MVGDDIFQEIATVALYSPVLGVARAYRNDLLERGSTGRAKQEK